MDDVRYKTVTIGAGASLSPAAPLLPNDGSLMALITASTWDAAKITFQGSVDGTNFFDITKEGTEYEVASVTGAKWISVEPQNFLAVRYLKVRSGTSAAAVNQVDATIVTLVMREL